MFFASHKATLSVLLAVVVVALGILTSWFVALPAAAIAKTTAVLVTYHSAITNYHQMLGRWPTTLGELSSNASGITFIDQAGSARDGWSRPIVYEPYTTNAGFGSVLSYGRDGKPGGIGADTDLALRFQ